VVVGTGLSCLPVFHVNLGTVLSFCGMGGLAISLLSKGVVVNLIGSLTIYLTQPFTLGDWIQTLNGEVDGWVQAMGPYHTVVMQWDRRPVYIPNSRLTQVQIINASRMTNRRILQEIPVRFADLTKIDSVLDDIRDFIENHKDLDPEQHRHARFRQIGAYGAIIWVSCYTKGVNLTDWVTVTEDVLLGIKNIMFKHGMTFATTLERETKRVDSTGAFLTEPYDSVAPGPPLSANYAEEVYQRPQMPIELKTEMKTELKSLKQKQESLFVRERDLKDSEATLQRERDLLQKTEADIAEQRADIDAREAELDESLMDVAARDEKVQERESEIEAEMDELQAREEALDEILRKKRARAGTEQRWSDGVKDQEEMESADRAIEEYQEELSQQKKEIERERKDLEAQKAVESTLDDPSSSDPSSGGPPSESPPAGPATASKAGENGGGEEDQDAPGAGADAAADGEEERPQFQKIAESLGGE